MSGQVKAIQPFEIPERRSPSPVEYGKGFESFGKMILQCAEKRNLSARFYIPASLFWSYAEEYLDLCKRVDEASSGALKLRSVIEVDRFESVSVVLEKAKTR